MNASVRLMPTKLAAAALAAGVVAAGTSLGAADRALPTIEAQVTNTSLVTDVLESVGWFTWGVSAGVGIPLEAVVSLPFDALTAIAISAQHPDYAPTMLSWLVNRYVNPSDAYLEPTYPWDFKTYAIGNIASALPYPLGPSATQLGLINSIAEGIADAIGSALSGLPDATIGEMAANAFWVTDAGRVLSALNYVPLAPIWAVWDVVDYVGFLPHDVEATIESAIRSPQDIPGLVSNLIYGLLDPDPQLGLAGRLITDLTNPLTVLPGPVGQFATNVVTNLQQGLTNLLANLPAPVTPTPLAAKTTVGTAPAPTAAVQGAGATDIPSTTGPSKNAVTLTVTDTPDTSKVADTSKDSDTPKAPENKTEAPAADTTAAGTSDKAEKPAGKTKSGKIKSGNKVRPGAKSTQRGAANPDKSTATEAAPNGADKPSTSDGAEKPSGAGQSGADHADAAA